MVEVKIFPAKTQETAERREVFYSALESGDYKNGKGSLKVEDTYCCLGVACDVSGVGSWGEFDGYSKDVPFPQESDYSSVVLPREVLQHYDFGVNWGTDSTVSGADPLFFVDMDKDAIDKDRTVTATFVNDHAQLDFPKIADMFRFFYPAKVDDNAGV